MSSGAPSELGLLTDATTLAKWAVDVAGIPPSRIVIFVQSLGATVSVSLAHHLATRAEQPTFFSAMVLVAPFADVELLTATYRVGRTVPFLDPIARFPWLMAFFNRFIVAKWTRKDKLAELVRVCETSPDDAARYHVTIIHAEDDDDIPCHKAAECSGTPSTRPHPRGLATRILRRRRPSRGRTSRGLSGRPADAEGDTPGSGHEIGAP